MECYGMTNPQRLLDYLMNESAKGNKVSFKNMVSALGTTPGATRQALHTVRLTNNIRTIRCSDNSMRYYIEESSEENFRNETINDQSTPKFDPDNETHAVYGRAMHLLKAYGKLDIPTLANAFSITEHQAGKIIEKMVAKESYRLTNIKLTINQSEFWLI